MRHHIRIYQLNAKYGNAFLNVDEELCDGAVSVWGGCYTNSVYLLQSGINFTLMVFSVGGWDKEWLKDHGKEYEKITQIYPLSS